MKLNATPKRRYLHLLGGCAAGGWFPKAGPNGSNVPIPSVAPVHLPMTGGRCENSATNVKVDGANKTLMTLDYGYGLVESIPRNDPSEPARSFTKSEFKGLKIDGLSVDHAVLNLQNVHPPTDPFPHITFGDTKIEGLILGGKQLTVHLNTSVFDKYNTLMEFEAAFQSGSVPADIGRTFTKDKDGRLFRSSGGYAMGSIVSKVEGDLPTGATLAPDGFTIDWPEFGKIILGELTMSPSLRRVTMVRIVHCDGEHGGGCSGGGYYP